MDGSTRPGGGSQPHSGRGEQTMARPMPSAPLRRSLARMLVRGADRATRWVTRVLGESATAGRAGISEAELRDLVAQSEVLDRDERRLIDDVIVAGGRHVRELMVPRTEVVFLDAEMSLPQAALLVRASPHSRFPVVDGSHDDVVGFVHLRDLLIRPDVDTVSTVRDLARPLRQLPASKRVLVALSEMRREGDHLALVVDEYGGTAGIVSLEDLIEELVGEIHDEYDAVPDVDGAEGTPPPEVDGRLNLNDFAERVGCRLSTGPYDTVGGFLMAALGRLPALGDEVVAVDRGVRWRLTVVVMEGRRVARVGVAQLGLGQPDSAPVGAPRAAVSLPGSAGAGVLPAGSAGTGSAGAGSAGAGVLPADSTETGSAETGSAETGSVETGSAEVGQEPSKAFVSPRSGG